MSLPASWIDSLFERLAVRYGSKFIDAYAAVEGVTIDDVKKDWAEVLDGVSSHSIKYALVNLPLAWPPNANEFREICRRAPADPAAAPPSLPAPVVDPAVVAQAREKLKSLVIGERDPRAWLFRLKAREDAGAKLSSFQLQCMRNAEENLGISRDTTAEIVDDAEARRRTQEAQAATARQVEAIRQLNPDIDKNALTKEQRDERQRMFDRLAFQNMKTMEERTEALRATGDIAYRGAMRSPK